MTTTDRPINDPEGLFLWADFTTDADAFVHDDRVGTVIAALHELGLTPEAWVTNLAADADDYAVTIHFRRVAGGWTIDRVTDAWKGN